MQVVILIDNVLEQHNKTTHVVADVREFIKEKYPQFPPTARIYHQIISKDHDVTPGSKEEVDNLANLEGTIYIVIYPEGIDPVSLIVTLALTVLSYILAPKPPTPPVVSRRNIQESSPNNELSERTNRARPNERIPDIYGTVRATPDLLAVPYQIFDNNREVEISFMCLGRGYYDVDDIKDGDTLISEISGSTVAIYDPYTSPNSGDDPMTIIGTPIDDLILNVRKSNSVNGQLLKAPNASVFQGAGNIFFRYPDEIVAVSGSAIDFTEYFESDDSLVITSASYTDGTTAVDLAGTYTILSVVNGIITLSNPAAVNADWNDIASYINDRTGIVDAKLETSGDRWIGPFTLDTSDLNSVYSNFVCTNGLYKDDGSTQTSLEVEVEIGLTPLDVNGTPTGAEEFFQATITGSATNRDQKAITLRATPSFDGKCSARARRVTTTDLDFAGTVVDDVKWRDLYSVSPITVPDFGNITTVHSQTYATSGALSVKERKLNLLATRKIYNKPDNHDYDGNIFAYFRANSDAKYFEATGQSATLICNPENATSPGVISFRVKFNSGTFDANNRYIMSAGGLANNVSGITIRRNTAGQIQVYCCCSTYGGSWVSAFNAIANTDYDLSIIANATECRIYDTATGDFIAGDSVTTGGPATAQGIIRMGQVYNSALATATHNAEIYLFALWDGTKTIDEMKNLNTTGLEHLYGEDRNEGSTWYDRGSAGVNLTGVSGAVLTSNFLGTNNAADILAAVCLDPYIGNRQLAEIDFDSIYNTIDEIKEYFGQDITAEFSYTFDNNNISFEETAYSIGNAVYSTVYRQGNIIRLDFERATEDSVLLFNHRNKIPGSETRTIRFGNEKGYDGIELQYVDPSDDAIASLFIPEDRSAVNSKIVETVGIRNKAQANLHIWREYNKIKFQNTAVEFEATQEAATLVKNNRILVADNTRPDTQDGEVLAQDGLTLTLSQNVEFEDGIDYLIFVQHINGTVESIPITAGSNDREVLLSQAPSLPLAVDPDLYARATYTIVSDVSDRTMAFLLEEKDSKESSTFTIKAVNYSPLTYMQDQLMFWVNDRTEDKSSFFRTVTKFSSVSEYFDASREEVLRFDGYLSFSDLTAPASYTKMAWLKKDNFATVGHILSSSGTEHEKFYIKTDGTLNAGHGADNVTYQITSSDWIHAAVSYSADDETMILYVNGVEVSRDETVSQRTLGGLHLGASGGANMFLGLMDDARLYPRALNAQEIRLIYKTSLI